MSDGGFFLMHRGWRDSPIFKGEFSRADAWVWLIENACWKPTRFDVKGRTMTLERGQLCASRERLAKLWGWSPSAVERFLTRLKTEQMIERETGQGKSVITVCNYSKYQDKADETGQETGPLPGQESDRHRTAKEQGNKGTSDEEAKASPSQRASKTKLVRMTADWVPGPLPADVAELVAEWPPGRFEREVANTRDYWLDRKDRRPGWDRTLHNRIRDIHDRVMRETQNGRGQANRNDYSDVRDRRDGLARALDEIILDERPGRAAGAIGQSDDARSARVLSFRPAANGPG